MASEAETPPHNELAVAASLDALPYVDAADDEYEAMALSLVEEEMQHIAGRPAEDLKPLKIKADSSLFQSEYDQRTRREGPLPPLDLDETGNKSKRDVEQMNINELQEAVKKARIAYEKERLREAVLAAEKQESGTLWKRQVESSLAQQSTLQQRLDARRSTVEQINAVRQREQEGYGREIDRASRNFHELVSKRLQLQAAIAQLEQELSSE